MQFPRFRIISISWPSKSLGSQEEATRRLRGVQGQHQLLPTSPSLSLPSRQIPVPSPALELLLSSVPGSKWSLWRQELVGKHHNVCSRSAAERGGESHREALVGTGKPGAGGRRGGSRCGHTMGLEPALPLAAPFLLAPTYTAQSKVQ